MTRILSFKNLRRTNAVLIFLICVSLLVMVSYALFSEWQRQMHLSQYSDEEFAAERELEASLMGEELDTPWGMVIGYVEKGASIDFPTYSKNDATFVNMADGKSLRVLSDNDRRKIVNWRLIQDKRDGTEPAIGFIAMLATESDFPKGLADVEIGLFSTMERRQISTKVEALDVPAVFGSEAVSMIIWHGDVDAKFVSVDLTTGNKIDEKPVNLPKLKDATRARNQREDTREMNEEVGAPRSQFGLIE